MTHTCAPVSADSFGAGSIGVRRTWRADGAPRGLDVGERDGHGAPSPRRASPNLSRPTNCLHGLPLRPPVAREIISRRPIIRETALCRSDNDNVGPREEYRAESLGCSSGLAALLAGLCTGPARAQDYPDAAGQDLIAFPVGGLLDTVSRIVGEKLGGLLGQQFLIEARPGAGGTIATQAVAKADPDGYTLMMINDNHALNPSVFKNIPYDSVKDFAPIGFVGYTPLILAANPNVPART